MAKQKPTSTQLKEAYERFEILAKVTKDLVWDWDLQKGTVWWNDALQDHFGYDAHQIEPGPESWSNRIHPDDKERVLATIYQVIEQGSTSWSDQYRFQRADGSYALVEDRGCLIRRKGKGVRMLGSMRDLSQQPKNEYDLQRRVQQQLQQTTFDLQAVLDGSPAAIGLISPLFNTRQEIVDFEVRVCNQTMGQLARRSPQDVIGQPVTPLYPGIRQTGLFQRFVEVFQTGEALHQEVPSPRDPDRWLSMSVTRHPHGIVVSVLDTTNLRKLQQHQQHWLAELEHAQANTQALQALQAVVQQRGELLRAASHDLRSNLSLISGAAHLLEEVASEPEQNQMLAIIRRNIAQAIQMLTDLLDYARLEAGQEKVHLAPFNVADLLTDLMISLQPMATQKGLILTNQGPAFLAIVGDALHIRRIAQNLLLNAIKYTSTGSVSLTWGIDSEQDQWWLSIQDTGPGLPFEWIQRVMQPQDDPTSALAFEQPVTTNTSPCESKGVLPGEGIGLRIVRQLVDLLGAQMTVDSQPGLGTAFTIRLPINDPHHPRP